MRTLEVWQPEDDGSNPMNMGLGSSERGWSADEMFNVNASKFHVESSFKEDLEGYTVPLNKDRKSKEFR